MGDVRHNCGIVVTHSLHDVYSLTKSLQHRGREGAGIAGIREGGIDVLRWSGEISRFDMGNLHDIFSEDYHSFFGHVRYATSGRKDMVLEDTHPVVIGGEEERRNNHIFIRGADVACVINGHVDNVYFPEDSDKRDSDAKKFLHFYRQHGEKELLKRIPGSYTAAIADVRKKDVIVLRDRAGIRPGILGVKDGKHVVASEEVAFAENGANFVEDLERGSVYYLASDGSYRIERVVSGNPQSCFFEGNYISHVLSSLDGVKVRTLRQRLGEQLAKEHLPENLDFITYLPRCPEPAARSYASAVGLPFVPVFYKTRAERSFQGPTTEERKKSISNNLWLLPGMEERLKGKRVGCIDDSTIRGNNSRRARELLYDEAGVEEAWLLNYTPKIGIIGEDGIERGCDLGVDMPIDDNFVARNRTDDEISEIIGMPTRFLSLEGMLKVFTSLGIRRKNLCTFCVGGSHPFRG